jgi:hypothetical protein
MTYRVVFAKRFQSDGRESAIDPTAELDVYLPDGVVAAKTFVERFEPEAKHSQEILDEDDAFLGMASAEVWEYEVLDERRQDFVDAVQNSQTVMEVEVVDESATDADDLSSPVNLADGDTKVPADAGDSGDGPAGRGLRDSIAGDGADSELEGLTIRNAEDPRLGMTNVGGKPAQDWAADTGPTREGGVRS